MSANVFADVSGPIPVPRLQLVLLGVEILLLVGERRRLTQLEPAVDAVVAGETSPRESRGCGSRRARSSAAESD